MRIQKNPPRTSKRQPWSFAFASQTHRKTVCRGPIFFAALVLIASIGFDADAHADEYPEDVKAAFLEGCEETVNAAHCGCVLAKLEDTVELEEFTTGTIAGGVLSAAVDECVREVQILPGEWPQDVVSEFEKSCVEGGGSKEECTCTISELKKGVALADVVQDRVTVAKLRSVEEKCRAAE